MSDWKKGALLYEGKAKQLFEVQGQPDLVWMEYKDSLTAFNAQKKGEFLGKGAINWRISRILFQQLHAAGVRSHEVASPQAGVLIAEKLTMIPLEVVVRNRIAGSLAKKLGREEGEALREPLVEFYLKDDALGDPFLSEEQIRVLDLVPTSTVRELKEQAIRVNQVLLGVFAKCGIDLVDFKLEFGAKGDIRLADEISPDSCRLWDQASGERLDKDRFRRDLGQVAESYQEVLRRLEGFDVSNKGGAG